MPVTDEYKKMDDKALTTIALNVEDIFNDETCLESITGFSSKRLSKQSCAHFTDNNATKTRRRREHGCTCEQDD